MICTNGNMQLPRRKPSGIQIIEGGLNTPKRWGKELQRGEGKRKNIIGKKMVVVTLVKHPLDITSDVVLFEV